MSEDVKDAAREDEEGLSLFQIAPIGFILTKSGKSAMTRRLRPPSWILAPGD